ncbi:DMT family transporter [Falsiroseomonas sp.]|uniref:DMT family transporter n=1 Tax=Falsiroseomonas sp. TaxID=2870721 RepID=UPI003F6E7F3C
MTQTTKAALLALAASLLFTLETLAVKALVGVPIATLVLARAIGQLAWTVPDLIRSPVLLVRTGELPMQIFRGLLSAIAWYLYYVSFSGMKLATATVLSFTTVLFVTAMAAPLLGEKVGWRRWTATIVGFVGVLIIMRPGMVPVGVPVLAAIAASVFGAGILITTKRLARTERTVTIMFYVGVVALCVSLPIALPGLAWPGWWNAGLLLAAAVLGPAAMWVWIMALRMADASFIAPLSYVRLLYAVFFGVVLFGEVPEWWLLPGGALIIGSTLYITRREAMLQRARAASSAAPSSAKSA